MLQGALRLSVTLWRTHLSSPRPGNSWKFHGISRQAKACRERQIASYLSVFPLMRFVIKVTPASRQRPSCISPPRNHTPTPPPPKPSYGSVRCRSLRRFCHALPTLIKSNIRQTCHSTRHAIPPDMPFHQTCHSTRHAIPPDMPFHHFTAKTSTAPLNRCRSFVPPFSSRPVQVKQYPFSRFQPTL